jgi:hypothetical protein
MTGFKIPEIMSGLVAPDLKMEEWEGWKEETEE